MGSVEELLNQNNANFSLGLMELMPILTSMLRLDTLSVSEEGTTLSLGFLPLS